MIDKLQDIIHHFEELEQQMIDPSLINNQNKYKEVTREHRRLSPVVDKSKNYMGKRCNRFSMLIINNKIEKLYIEKSGEFNVSSAETIFKEL